MDAVALVRRYYDALDDHDYDALEELLKPEFVQHRPDRTFADREAFVAFMRDERPNPATSHELESVIAGDGRVAVRGRVIEDETVLFEFADFFDIGDGRLRRLETYSR
ncbi:nuclear transport factor 2 family protein [Natrinema longum]|uniref:Nuclear transport factor 2 family protein n=1 Tax=Natrinema longum TaxID=370324 RepID=A0A8A2U5D9_9EURY|nr:nuclear transport factor 2 family protein [Natrinema longum]MBZ6494665.1 nuclear transport factor 2 family protein [Natrinema longum]QSW84021.1 nuclear transport factor 2 family protein [Natrinema longum]